MRKLLILGAGQYGYVVQETALAIGIYEKIDFLDDNNPIAIGKLQEYQKFSKEYDYFFVAIGNSLVRKSLIEDIELVGLKLATLIHPRAYVMYSAIVEKAVIVEAMAVVNANSRVEKGSIVSAGAVVNHNCVVGAYCHVDCNATIKAGNNVPAGRKVECGQVYSHVNSLENYSFEDGI